MHESGTYCGPADKGCGIIIEEKRSQAVYEKKQWLDLVKHYIFIKGGNPCKAWISIENVFCAENEL